MKITKKIKTSMIDSFMWEITKTQPCYNALALMELDASLDEHKLIAALSKFVEIAPVVAAKPVFGILSGYWKVKENFDPSLLFTSIELDNLNKVSETIEQLRKSPTDMAEGPYIHIFLIRAKEKYFYAFKMHHFISDGSGMLFMMDQIAKCYREIDHDPEWVPTVVPTTERGVSQIIKQLSYSQYMTGMKLNSNNKYKNQQGTIVIGDYKGSADNLSADTENHKVISERLNPEIADSIKERVKEKGYILGDLIMATTMCSVANWNKQKDSNFQAINTRYAVDLRRWGKTDANIANISCVQMHQAPSEELSNVNRAIDYIKPQLDSERQTMGLDYLWKYRFLSFMPAFIFRYKGDFFREQYLNTVTQNHGLTYMGLIPDSIGNFGHASALTFSLLPPPIPRPNVLFLVSSFKGDLTINIGYNNLHLKEESASSLVDIWKDLLLSFK